MLRMEIALFLVVAFVAYMYFTAEKEHTALHKTFLVLLVAVLVHLALDGRHVAAMALADPIRPEAASIGIIGGATFWVECSACGACSSSHDDEYDAIAAWNHRPIEDALQARIDALKASGIEALRRAEVAEQERDTYKAKVNVLVAENRSVHCTLQRVFSQCTALLRNCDRTQTVNDAIAVLRKAGLHI